MNVKWKSLWYYQRPSRETPESLEFGMRVSVYALQPHLNIHLWINICEGGKKHVEKRLVYFLDV